MVFFQGAACLLGLPAADDILMRKGGFPNTNCNAAFFHPPGTGFRAFYALLVGACCFDFRRGREHGSVMVIEVPEQIEAMLTPESAALNLALGLFVSKEVSLGQGAKIARLPYSQFMKELGKRKIAIYGETELEEDLRTIEKLAKK